MMKSALALSLLVGFGSNALAGVAVGNAKNFSKIQSIYYTGFVNGTTTENSRTGYTVKGISDKGAAIEALINLSETDSNMNPRQVPEAQECVKMAFLALSLNRPLMIDFDGLSCKIQ